MKGENVSIQGKVKSFSVQDSDTGKGGYGFLVCSEAPMDVWFGKRDVSAEVYEAVQNRILSIKDRDVTFDLVQKEDGKPQAHNVQLVAQLNDKLPGKIRSYNGAKGYGFFTCSSLEGQDVYFSKKELPPAQQGMSLPPNAVGSFTLVQTADGKLQAKEVQIVVTAAMMLGQEMPPPLAMAFQEQFTPRPSQKPGFQQGFNKMPPMAQAFAQAAGMWGGGGGGSEKSGLQGKVKSFFPDKGYGFIQSPSHPADIYFKGNGGMYEAGMSVTFTMTFTADGKAQAKQLAAGLEDGQMLEGTVRSYSPQNGYGFITAAEIGADVYFKGTMVPPEQQDGNYKGRHARFSVKMTQDGKPQVAELQFLDEARGFKRVLAEPASAPVQAARPRPTWIPARQQLQ